MVEVFGNANSILFFKTVVLSMSTSEKITSTIRHKGKICVRLFCSVDLHSIHLLYELNETLCFRRTQNWWHFFSIVHYCLFSTNFYRESIDLP